MVQVCYQKNILLGVKPLELNKNSVKSVTDEAGSFTVLPDCTRWSFSSSVKWLSACRGEVAKQPWAMSGAMVSKSTCKITIIIAIINHNKSHRSGVDTSFDFNLTIYNENLHQRIQMELPPEVPLYLLGQFCSELKSNRMNPKLIHKRKEKSFLLKCLTVTSLRNSLTIISTGQ